MVATLPEPKEDAMESFVARNRPLVTAVLSGFDRLVFRGTLLPLVMHRGMHTFLSRTGVQPLDFGKFALATSERVKETSLLEASQQKRPVRYLESSRIDKEALARRLLDEHPVEKGLICAFKTVEPCMSFEYHRSPDPNERGLRHPGLPQRSRVACLPARAQGSNRLQAPGQLLHVARRSRPGTAPDGPATRHRLEARPR